MEPARTVSPEAHETHRPPPSPRVPAILRLPAARKDPVGFLRTLAAQAGDVASFRVGRRRVVFVNDPAMIYEVLVHQAPSFSKAFIRGATSRIMGDSIFSSEGEYHDRQRGAIQPKVRHDGFDSVVRQSYTSALDMAQQWKSGESIDAWAQMQALTLRMTLLNLFGSSSPVEEATLRQALDSITCTYRRAVTPLHRILDRLPLSSTRQIERGLEGFHRWVDEQVELRYPDGGGRSDVIAKLVAHRFEDGDVDRMTRKELRDEAIDLFVGAHETVAAALTYALYLLAANPTEQQRLRSEVASALAGREPTLADLRALPFTGRAVRETMRMFAPAWIFLRMATADVLLGNFRVPAGSAVLLSPAVTHRDPRYFPDPNRFDPDRWLPTSPGVKSKEAYFPFGAGPRGCIGEPMALAEISAVLAAFSTVVEFQPVLAREPRRRPLVTNAPAEPVPVTIRRLDVGSPADS